MYINLARMKFQPYSWGSIKTKNWEVFKKRRYTPVIKLFFQDAKRKKYIGLCGKSHLPYSKVRLSITYFKKIESNLAHAGLNSNHVKYKVEQTKKISFYTKILF
uniref:Uncharacterized protein n=1 Tax=Cacopsylla melanoneura TaxID=428564 RepID=A0A8D8M0M8_9HEMI